MDTGSVLVIFILATCAAVVLPFIIIPVAKAWSHRIEGKSGPGDRLLGEVDELKSRVNELEERLEFTERLLAQGRETSRIEGD